MPNILFRADAENSIGTGDLMSLIYLSREFHKNSWGCFFMVKNYQAAAEIIKRYKIENVHFIPCDVTTEEEIGLIKDACKLKSIDCLLMEITKNSLQDYGGLGRPAQVKACINFDGLITPDFDIVVNWCIDASDRLYEPYLNRYMQVIQGFERTILPDYFDWERISRRQYNKEIKNILISMGGVDEFNLSKKIAQALSCRADAYEIKIITGAGYEYQDELASFMERNFATYSLRHNIDNMLEDYLWADIAFSAGGLISSELVAAKTPAAIISAYPHQIARCRYYSDKQWSYYAGHYDTMDEKRIISSLYYLTDNINLFRDSLYRAKFRGGNKKIYESIYSCRQSKELV